MPYARRLFVRSLLFITPLACLGLATPARAYVDLAPTLSKIVLDSKTIALVEVVEFSRDKGSVVLKEVRALKGEPAADLVRHQVASAERASIPRHILQWAAPGARGVLFVSRNTALVCVGRGWYQARASGTDGWKLGADRPDLPLAYYGPVSQLAEGIERMLAGKDAVLTTVAHGADAVAASFDLALNRASLPGLVKVERIRANLKMPPMVIAASANPAYVIGQGPVDEGDLPALLEKLRSSDAAMRTEAAEDLGWLGGKADAAAKPLMTLLNDPTPHVRASAAAALLRIVPKNSRAVEVLVQCLDSPDRAERCAAARAVSLVGPPAAPLAGKLVALLKDTDEPTRIAAIQAISMLGPVAAMAVEAVTPLLDDADLMIDAADALGRIGPAARPALKRLPRMLSAEQPAVRWAAVRAMSQIGGEEARPAVDFMIRELPRASEVDGYNMMIYLALLGPVARDAVPIIRSVRIKNPVLPSATLWAIESDKSFPWLSRGRAGGPPGMAGPGGEGPDFARYIYEAYINELGDRLGPAARVLAQKIMEGTAGDIPNWGYRILTCSPTAVLEALSSHLADHDIVVRERAIVALGYMGAAAAPARDRVATALSKAATERERRLIEWCLREIDGE